MSLPGVESARRRRASHRDGRSSVVGSLQPPALHHRRSNPLPYSSPFPVRSLVLSTITGYTHGDEQYQIALNQRAMAARHRLDERLRAPTHISSRPSISSRQLTPSYPGIRASLAKGGMHGGGHDDCPVCLDSFLSGQMVLSLPCKHTFHSDCLVPWLSGHPHCPSCRSSIASKADSGVFVSM